MGSTVGFTVGNTVGLNVGLTVGESVRGPVADAVGDPPFGKAVGVVTGELLGGEPVGTQQAISSSNTVPSTQQFTPQHFLRTHPGTKSSE